MRLGKLTVKISLSLSKNNVPFCKCFAKKLYCIFSILQTRARNYLSIIFMYLQCVNDVVMIKVDDAAS